MNREVALVGGVGLGAALMYVFDPDRGKRRRALVPDKAEAAGNKVSDRAGKMRRDLSNRAYGIVAETKSIFQHAEVSASATRLAASSPRLLAFCVAARPWQVLFDVSGSMSEAKTAQAKQALAGFIQTSHPLDEFFLISFDSQAHLLLAGSRDGDAV